MNFNQLKSNLKFPKSNQFFLHTICDYIEMNIFLYGEGISLEDLLGSIGSSEKRLLRSFYRDKIKLSEMLDFDLEDVLYLKEERICEDGNEDEIGSIEPELDDEEQIVLQAVYAQLRDRERSIGIPYPFEFRDMTYIQLKTKIQPVQKQYLMLLICTHHNLFSGHDSSKITTEFERVAYCALQKYFPPYAKVFELGKNTELPSRAIPKLIQLGEEMGIVFNKKNAVSISPRNVNEEGTDIIAWLPFQDLNVNKLVFLFQVTCQKKWFNKQVEVSRYDKLFNFSINPVGGLILPYLFNEGDTFCREIDVTKTTLLFDRGRILELIKRKRNCTKKLMIYKTVQNILNDL